MDSRIQHTEIGILLYPQVLQSAVLGLTDQFAIANMMAARHDLLQPHAIRVSHWQVTNRNSTHITRVFDTHPQAEGPARPAILIVPPRMAEPISRTEAKPFADWVAAQHAGGTTVSSVCAGSYILAEAGLLNGRASTTHWAYTGHFAARFPDTHVDGDKLLIDDGDIITTGGMMAWIDLGLRLIHRVLGPAIMMETARFMLVDPPGREQRYYSSFAPNLTHGDAAILKVQHWLQKTGARAVTVNDMAERAGMEERTFLRHFQKATGLKPTEYCQQLRISKAREMLELTRQTVEQIAWAVGYEDASAFRKLFQKVTGLAPGEYRVRFAIASAPEKKRA